MSALKDQPLSLALVVMNIPDFSGYNANEQGDYRRQIAELLIKQFRETKILLSKCVDAGEVRKLLQAGADYGDAARLRPAARRDDSNRPQSTFECGGLCPHLGKADIQAVARSSDFDLTPRRHRPD
jgi:hypothetical protein